MGSRSFQTVAVLGLYTETPLHCGTESGSGFVDLPIQRERHSGFPVIPGSTIKGVLRDETEDEWGALRDVYFGAQSEEKDASGVTKEVMRPGSVSFGDGFLVAFPVRSAKVPFAWVTCPMVLERTYRAMGTAWPADLKPPGGGAGWSDGLSGQVLLEDLIVTVGPAPKVGNQSLLAGVAELLPSHSAFRYTRRTFSERLVVVSDEAFGWLVESATEVVTRIRLDENTHTTSGEKGNMFNEELIPRDTLFASVLRELKPQSVKAFPFDKVPDTIRLGGDETIGRGVTWTQKRAQQGNR